MNRYILEGFLEELAKEGSTYVGGFSPGTGFSGGDENGGMHRFINTRAMQHMAMGGGFKSSGNFEGVAMAPGGGGFMPAFSGGEGGFTADLPGGGMLHNYAPSASMRAAMSKVGHPLSPELVGGLLGGAVGATGGALSDKEHRLRNGLAGGVLGGLGGAAGVFAVGYHRAGKRLAEELASYERPPPGGIRATPWYREYLKNHGDSFRAGVGEAHPKTAEKTLRDAFDEKVDDKGKWTGGLNSEGYPKMRDGKKIRLASHVALELAGRGPAPSNNVVAHKDDNPLNVSASNLEIITQKHNLQDCEDRGRWRPRGPNKPDDAK